MVGLDATRGGNPLASGVFAKGWMGYYTPPSYTFSFYGEIASQ